MPRLKDRKDQQLWRMDRKTSYGAIDPLLSGTVDTAAVEVLARFRGEPVLIRERNVTCATFHPELTADARVHAQAFA